MASHGIATKVNAVFTVQAEGNCVRPVAEQSEKTSLFSHDFAAVPASRENSNLLKFMKESSGTPDSSQAQAYCLTESENDVPQLSANFSSLSIPKQNSAEKQSSPIMVSDLEDEIEQRYRMDLEAAIQHQLRGNRKLTDATRCATRQEEKFLQAQNNYLAIQTQMESIKQEYQKQCARVEIENQKLGVLAKRLKSVAHWQVYYTQQYQREEQAFTLAQLNLKQRQEKVEQAKSVVHQKVKNTEKTGKKQVKPRSLVEEPEKVWNSTKSSGSSVWGGNALLTVQRKADENSSSASVKGDDKTSAAKRAFMGAISDVKYSSCSTNTNLQ
ncbi:hypothetical protein D5R81_18315 [Parashewanella spongiae]|uniref:Uncharacterized protein n=1 Tax=Parashewanella spongiae TaxID=342950 RepID=A0A3A6TM46_9GAMM|nr:hypothetical protein [Parashewanella spongiae]MCL1078755.1 hypothetical protein [Parashewanella spongiae]RJY05986.1 hypothetical protein D5R81_18315 [Parashewanella spongiae]